jgi:hypothetical protein
MKKTIIISIVFLFFFSILNVQSDMQRTVVKMKKVKQGGTKMWNDVTFCKCWWPGHTCIVTTSQSLSNITIERADIGGWLLTAQVESLTETNTETLETVVHYASDLENYPISYGEYELIIEECGAFPELEGVTIELNNLVLRQQGYFTVFIPPIN